MQVDGPREEMAHRLGDEHAVAEVARDAALGARERDLVDLEAGGRRALAWWWGRGLRLRGMRQGRREQRRRALRRDARVRASRHLLMRRPQPTFPLHPRRSSVTSPTSRAASVRRPPPPWRSLARAGRDRGATGPVRGRRAARLLPYRPCRLVKITIMASKLLSSRVSGSWNPISGAGAAQSTQVSERSVLERCWRALMVG